MLWQRALTERVPETPFAEQGFRGNSRGGGNFQKDRKTWRGRQHLPLTRNAFGILKVEGYITKEGRWEGRALIEPIHVLESWCKSNPRSVSAKVSSGFRQKQKERVSGSSRGPPIKLHTSYRGQVPQKQWGGGRPTMARTRYWPIVWPGLVWNRTANATTNRFDSKENTTWRPTTNTWYVFGESLQGNTDCVVQFLQWPCGRKFTDGAKTQHQRKRMPLDCSQALQSEGKLRWSSRRVKRTSKQGNATQLR